MTGGEPIGRRVQSRIYRNGALGVPMATPRSPDGLERAARRRMSARAFAYVAGSAGAERTARANIEAFDRWQIVPRMLRDVGERDTSVEIFGRRHPTPFLLSPIGVQELAHPEADVATARAAAATGVPMVFSSQASRPMEECAAVMGDAARWFQLYWSSDDDVVVSFLERAEACGCEALVVTLDTHVLGWRPRDLDRAFLPFAHGMGIAQYTSDPAFMRLAAARADKTDPNAPRPRPTLAAIRTLLAMSRRHPGRFSDNLRSPMPRAAVETFLDVFSRSTLTWDDLGFLREHTTLPIVLKGIQDPHDAVRAVDAGVDGIVVSNHGGRQVDGAIGSLTVLPEIVARVGGALPVFFDSGVRTGADAFKALALGATAIGIGRPYMYGLALDGAAGVEAVVDHFAAELDLTMALAGASRVGDIDAGFLRHR
ncbi:alpha-hydroxy-acid oxidizing protein [Phytomonospora endophytica]|uniref:Isopentenyl diphosphate isomerase/L-lactate dehydrogenase-like FMN-dependent dehydrogenase n=1 Tax=Phytomonospora endophytica TaxID=714109 RepID=A0A841FLG4_9ACTN|nr:alpha-hydroxy-acid oxidizing protein [Phytomonospora endophytica]MBB6034027.1 isopentenyl diphosphate isomerase/L-lactate dehydrogenase-like FMN-dependent dehydrogenase [Phytomonospora endophytica]GIG64452.1 lactate 2-monooxygenase [Phytomonospora endophytica]